MQRLLGVVLCGGRSSRMGRDKATLAHPEGGTFVSHAIERVRPLCEEVCIAGSFSSTVDVPVLEDPVAHEGPIVGILQALAFADQKGFAACLVTPVDMPYLSSEDLERLQQAWAMHQQLCCGREESNGQIQPLVAVYPVSHAESLANHARNDRSLVEWLKTQTAIEVPLSPSACHNVNKPEDHL
ncbi:MAG: molybdenum cofactor guanylyltransferase [Rubripirellula sp.]